MAVEYIVIKTAQDTMDAGTLLLTEIALIMASISTGISVFLLTDWFKRRGWQYKHRSKKQDKEDREMQEYLKKDKAAEQKINFEKL